MKSLSELLDIKRAQLWSDGKQNYHYGENRNAEQDKRLGAATFHHLVLTKYILYQPT